MFSKSSLFVPKAIRSYLGQTTVFAKIIGETSFTEPKVFAQACFSVTQSRKNKKMSGKCYLLLSVDVGQPKVEVNAA